MASINDWAQLVSTTDLLSEPVTINKDKFFIGRSKGADLSLSTNKLVSGTHCFIERDTLGQFWLQDCSTNGTLLNLTHKIVGRKNELHHGDEISLVYKKSDTTHNVSYLFQDLSKLVEEQLNETQEYELTSDCDTSRTVPDTSTSESSPDRKRKCDASPENATISKMSKVEEDSFSAQNDIPLTNEVTTSKDKSIQLTKSIDKDSDITKNTDAQKNDDDDTIAENLICLICQEIFHMCISLQPCMHSFCAGCYSDWMTRSGDCPSCRNKVERINKNHMVNNLVDAYLFKHPKKKRSQEDIDELDKKNKITKDMLIPKPPSRTFSEFIDNEDDEDDEDDESASSDDNTTPAPFVPLVPYTGITTGLGTFSYTPKTVCRQCPEYKPPGSSSLGQVVTAIGTALSGVAAAIVPSTSTDTSAAGPSTSAAAHTVVITPAGDEKVMPPIPAYQCIASQTHLLCQCCLQPMPDRRTASTTDPDIPPQQCSLCYRAFCHSYWGCKKADCTGCLSKFKDLKFAKAASNGLLLENLYESDVLKNYLEKCGKNSQDLLKECCMKLEAKEFACMDEPRGLNSDTVVCYSCGLRNFRDLAYCYRKAIPNDQLPLGATSRPNCHWGKNCRTQKCKPIHAAKFNHICEQTRFT